MTYEQIISNLKSLGFADTSDYEEYEAQGYTYDAINRAISEIATQVPYIAKFEYEVTEDGLIGIDMTQLVDNFREFTSVPVRYQSSEGLGVYEKVSDFEIDADKKTLWFEGAGKGKYWIYYKAQPTMINSDTDPSFVCELPLRVHHLIPLLSAYYLWLDDEPTKSAQYYNAYETGLNGIINNDASPRMRVVTGYSKWGSI